MYISKYDIFLKILDLGNFTKTAEYFGYTQSAISQNLRALENELGVSLLVRSSKGISLTTEGELVLPYIQNICESEHHLNEMLTALAGGCEGIIRVGSFHSIGSHWLPMLIQGFQRQYPHVRFELYEGNYTEIEVWLASNRIDLGFLGIQDLTGFELRELSDDPLLVILPKDHPCAGLPYFPVERLKEEPFILQDEGKTSDAQILLDQFGLNPNICFRSKDDQTIMAMVECGLGLSVLSALVVQRNTFQIAAKPTNPLCTRKLGIALRKEKNESTAVKLFLQYIDENFSPHGQGFFQPPKYDF